MEDPISLADQLVDEIDIEDRAFNQGEIWMIDHGSQILARSGRKIIKRDDLVAF